LLVSFANLLDIALLLATTGAVKVADEETGAGVSSGKAGETTAVAETAETCVVSCVDSSAGVSVCEAGGGVGFGAASCFAGWTAGSRRSSAGVWAGL